MTMFYETMLCKEIRSRYLLLALCSASSRNDMRWMCEYGMYSSVQREQQLRADVKDTGRVDLSFVQAMHKLESRKNTLEVNAKG